MKKIIFGIILSIVFGYCDLSAMIETKPKFPPKVIYDIVAEFKEALPPEVAYDREGIESRELYELLLLQKLKLNEKDENDLYWRLLGGVYASPDSRDILTMREYQEADKEKLAKASYEIKKELNEKVDQIVENLKSKHFITKNEADANYSINYSIPSEPKTQEPTSQQAQSTSFGLSQHLEQQPPLKSQKWSGSKKVVVVGGTTILIGSAIGLVYWLYKRNQEKKKKEKEAAKSNPKIIAREV